ncbi:hypothetical protein L6R50_26095 [Myxococcota bacterium]|nr:hypothetical protein [Myxococcota bacterium]
MRPAPCIPFDAEGRHCIAGLLLGVRCCPDGNCALCRRAGGRDPRSQGLDRCPVCGFPPPPPLQAIPPLPRLDRSDRVVGGNHECRTCGRPLPPRRRTYCSFACWREFVRREEMDGNDIASPSPPRVFRASLG